MQALLEKPPVDDQTELAATALEPVADFLKTAAETPPALAAAEPPLKSGGWTPPGYFEYTPWAKQSGKSSWYSTAWKAMGYPQFPMASASPHGDTPGEAIQEAATGWCKSGALGVPGTGQPDVEMTFPRFGPILVAEVADFLDYAAERIIRFGWVKGTERYGDYVCSVGALRLRMEQLAPRMSESRAMQLSEQACGALTSYLRRHKGNMNGIIGWNDATGRTMGEVVTAFREAAAELRGVSAPRIRRAVLA